MMWVMRKFVGIAWYCVGFVGGQKVAFKFMETSFKFWVSWIKDRVVANLLFQPSCFTDVLFQTLEPIWAVLIEADSCGGIPNSNHL